MENENKKRGMSWPTDFAHKHEVRELNAKRSSDTANFAFLAKTMPLDQMLTIVGTMLSDRSDLDGVAMQKFQRKIADLTWPLVTVDHEVAQENADVTLFGCTFGDTYG